MSSRLELMAPKTTTRKVACCIWSVQTRSYCARFFCKKVNDKLERVLETATGFNVLLRRFETVAGPVNPLSSCESRVFTLLGQLYSCREGVP